MREWYFLPYYAILRSITFDVLGIPGKLIGVVLMFGGGANFVPGAVARRIAGTRRPVPASTASSRGSW